MTDKLKMYNGYVDDDYDHINTSPTPPTAEDAVNAFVEDEKARLVDAIKETAKGGGNRRGKVNPSSLLPDMPLLWYAHTSRRAL